jgi:hypothetical protein
MQLIIGLLFIVLLQGCNSNESSQHQYGLVNDAVSVTRTDSNAIISKDAINNISIEVGDLLKANITAFNQKEAIIFSPETSYCDVSGVKESSVSNKSQAINNTINYNHCKEVENIQNGKINLNYMETDQDDKCPECFTVTIEETYTFNQIKLFEDASLEGDVTYNQDGSIQKIEFKINGNVNYKNENYHLQNIIQSVHY